MLQYLLFMLTVNCSNFYHSAISHPNPAGSQGFSSASFSSIKSAAAIVKLHQRAVRERDKESHTDPD
jgi:hypothetical protein